MRKIKRYLLLAICIMFMSYLFACKKAKFKVSFIVFDKQYEVIEVTKKEKVKKPSDPNIEGQYFVEWLNNDEPYDFNNKVTSDLTLVGKFIPYCDHFGHTWVDATPSLPKHCSVCNITEGEKIYLAKEIILTSSVYSLTVGETFKVEAKVLPKEANQNVEWDMSLREGANATFNKETGEITTTSKGVIYVYAKSVDGSYLEEFIKIDVLRPLMDKDVFDAFNIITGYGSNASTDIEINYHTHNTKTTVEYTTKDDPEFINKKVVSPTSGYYFTNGPEKVVEQYPARNVMRVSITGLTPNTDYIYRINKGNDTYTEVYSVKTSKNDGSKTTFYAAADIHYAVIPDGANGYKSHGSEISETVFNKALEKFPEIGFFATPGDTVDTGGNYRIWDMFYKHSTSLKTYARASVAGNHEYYFNDTGQTDFKYQKANCATAYNGPSTHIGATGYFVYNDVLFVSFDNEQSTGKDVQLKWLENLLKTTDANYTVIMMHSPIYYPATGSNAKDHDDELMALLEKYCVDLVIAGHYHSDNYTPDFYENQKSNDPLLGVNYISLVFGGEKSRSETNRACGYVFEVDNGDFTITRLNDLGEVLSVRKFSTKKYKPSTHETKENLLNSFEYNYDPVNLTYTISFSNKFYGNVKTLTVNETLREKISKDMCFPTPSYNKIVLKNIEDFYDYNFNITVEFEDGTTEVINNVLSRGSDIDLYGYTSDNDIYLEFAPADESLEQTIKEYAVYLNDVLYTTIPYLTDDEPTEYFELLDLNNNTTYDIKLVAMSYRKEFLYSHSITVKTE